MRWEAFGKGSFNFYQIIDNNMRYWAMAILCIAGTLMACASNSGGDTVRLPDDIQAFNATDTPTSLPFQLRKPSVEKGQKYPLVIFLHGAGERGTDNKRQMMNGATKILEFAENARKNIFLLAPQCPENDKWADVKWSAPTHTLNPLPTKAMAAVIHLIDSLVAAEPIDTNRIYVTGLSMGGFGTWDLAMRQPWRFAALVPVCGGGDERQAPKVARIPVWLFHGAKDQLVIPERSRNMVAALKTAGGNPRFTEYPEVGHNAWTYAYADSKMLNWLLDQTKAKK